MFACLLGIDKFDMILAVPHDKSYNKTSLVYYKIYRDAGQYQNKDYCHYTTRLIMTATRDTDPEGSHRSTRL